MKHVLHYCCGSYSQGNFGGVARFDYHISLAFPDREFFQGPGQKDALIKRLSALKGEGKEFVVIVDNHLALDIPNEYECIIVHHGVAEITYMRTPALKGNQFFEWIVKLQKQMLNYRDPKTTRIISCSENCIDDFQKLHPHEYSKFEKTLLWHPSELVVEAPKTLFSDPTKTKPVIIGNFDNGKKGGVYIPALQRELASEFVIKKLNVPGNKNVEIHNANKIKEYLSADMFLQLSTAEGNSYATLDAFACGLLVVGTDVGLLYDLKKINDDSAVIFSWEKMGDAKFVAGQIRKAWAEREIRNGKSRAWFEKNATIENWNRCIVDIIYKG